MNILLLLSGAAAGGLFYFTLSYLFSRYEYRKMNYIEIRNAQINEEMKKYKKINLSDKLTRKLDELGYQGNLFPVILAITMLYLILAIVLSIFGLSQSISILLALPTSILLSFFIANYIVAKKEALFQRQLLQVISLVVSSLDNGDNPTNAFEKAAITVGDPLKKEFLEAFQTMITAEDTISIVLEPVANKYRSRAFELVMAALSVDDKIGAKLGAPLRQAQITLEKEFELIAESNAEISQAKSEFYGLTIIISIIAFIMVTGSSGDAKAAYTSPLGIIVISILLSNYFFGILRTLKIFQKAKRGY